MRRIEFLAPVEAMRGNMSGKQNLLYPTKNNSAWNAPENKRSYSVNYGTRYIGAKRSSNGLKFFAVRQRNAVTNTPAQRFAQALLGGTKVVTDAILGNLATLQSLQQYFLTWKDHMSPEEFKKGLRYWVSTYVRQSLEFKETDIKLRNYLNTSFVVFSNPWNPSSTTGAVFLNVSEDILIKFWEQLTTGGYYFYVEGKTGVGKTGATFANINLTSDFHIPNPLAISSNNDLVISNLFDSRYLLDANNAGIEPTEVPTAGYDYKTTATQPE